MCVTFLLKIKAITIITGLILKYLSNGFPVKVAIAANKAVKSVDYTLTSVSGSAYTPSGVSIKLDGITAPTEY